MWNIGHMTFIFNLAWLGQNPCQKYTASRHSKASILTDRLTDTQKPLKPLPPLNLPPRVECIHD